MIRRFLALLCFALVPLAPAAPEKWAAEIDKFAAADAAQPPAKNGIVFVGSSSIRRWTTLAEDFAGLPVINRGFGGSQLSDAAFYAERIVTPYEPRTVVVYSGENDLAAGRTPEDVLQSFQELRAKIHRAVPTARIVFIGIKPSPSRLKHREAFGRANALIADVCATDQRLTFVDVHTPMLDANGEPQADLFVEDRLHLNAKGYALWTKLLRPYLR